MVHIGRHNRVQGYSWRVCAGGCAQFADRARRRRHNPVSAAGALVISEGGGILSLLLNDGDGTLKHQYWLGEQDAWSFRDALCG